LLTADILVSWQPLDQEGAAPEMPKAREGSRRLRPLLLIALGVCSVARAEPCPVPRLLPAYAHNDYYNARPLTDALSLGYQGVEADYVVVRGRVLVAHSRREAEETRTLESYLSS
jgi:hypothetical protein